MPANDIAGLSNKNGPAV